MGNFVEGRVAIVTGAGLGIGREHALMLAANGAKVVVNDLGGDAAGAGADTTPAQSVVDEILAMGGEAVVNGGNVADFDSAGEMVQQAVDAFGSCDILINNAGYSHSNKEFSTVTDQEFDRVYDVNVKAVVIAVQEAFPVFRRNGGGCLINTSSTAALRPRPGLAVYCSSKGAVSNLTKALAVELAPDKVRVNAICPVIGETGMLETFMGVPDTPENRKKFEATIPLGRFSTPNDIAQTMLFLSSDDAEFLTGVALEVDGGRCV